MAGELVRRRQTGTISAGGIATLTFEGPRTSQRWSIDRIAVRCLPSATLIPTAIVYRNSVGDGEVLGGTFTGNLDVNDNARISLGPGEQLVVQFTGGDPDDVATVSIEGEIL